MLFLDLPDEIVLHIFSFFSTEELLTQLKLVSARWRRLAEDRSLYRQVLINQTLSFHSVIRLLQTYKSSIKQLHIVERNDLNLLSSYIKECVYLECLILKLCFGSGDDISDAIDRCSHLNKIIIHHSSCIRNSPHFFRILSKLPVKTINLRSVESDMNANDITVLQNIEDLRLKNMDIDLFSISQFCTNNANSLTTLKLVTGDDNRTQYPDGFTKTLFEVLGQCGTLRKLYLGAHVTSELDDAGLFHLGRLNCLSTLVLHQTSAVTSIGFLHLFDQPLSKNLKKIGLYNCPSVTNIVLRAISNNCRQLEKFIFERHKSSSCDEELLTLVQNCYKLKTLHLFSMDISIANILHMLPTYLPSLQSLKFSNESDPLKIPSFLLRLEQQMPDFHISGLQWKFSLYVCCTRKTKTSDVNEIFKPVCAIDLKAYVDKMNVLKCITSVKGNMVTKLKSSLPSPNRCCHVSRYFIRSLSIDRLVSKENDLKIALLLSCTHVKFWFRL